MLTNEQKQLKIELRDTFRLFENVVGLDALDKYPCKNIPTCEQCPLNHFIGFADCCVEYFIYRDSNRNKTMYWQDFYKAVQEGRALD